MFRFVAIDGKTELYYTVMDIWENENYSEIIWIYIDDEWFNMKLITF